MEINPVVCKYEKSIQKFPDFFVHTFKIVVDS